RAGGQQVPSACCWRAATARQLETCSNKITNVSRLAGTASSQHSSRVSGCPRSSPAGSQPPRHKCGNQKSCPRDHFAFKIISGAANVVGPSICFDDTVLMSGVRNNIGRGLNIALVNGELAGQEAEPAPRRASRCPWPAGSIRPPSREPEVRLAPEMNDKVRALFTELGSSYASKLGFRDNWVFLGAKGFSAKSPFEGHIQNDDKTNKYDGWPELLELEGCAPRKMD
uniref:Family with sequence similarity 3 member D n=1 Tax=Apteryx owenii TaxID=8824 RepID=A0A8B9Q753_APTOW